MLKKFFSKSLLKGTNEDRTKYHRQGHILLACDMIMLCIDIYTVSTVVLRNIDVRMLKDEILSNKSLQFDI